MSTGFGLPLVMSVVGEVVVVAEVLETCDPPAPVAEVVRSVAARRGSWSTRPVVVVGSAV